MIMRAQDTNKSSSKVFGCNVQIRAWGKCVVLQTLKEVLNRITNKSYRWEWESFKYLLSFKYPREVMTVAAKKNLSWRLSAQQIEREAAQKDV